jgi:hypothetical protein
MKTLTRILFAIFLGCAFYACKKQSAPLTDTLPGRWTLTQYYSNPGGGGSWLNANDRLNGDLQFSADGELQTTVPDIIGNGTTAVFTKYAVSDSVTVKFTRTDNTYENYQYSIKSGILELYPKGPVLCMEGCGLRFKKNSN